MRKVFTLLLMIVFVASALSPGFAISGKNTQVTLGEIQRDIETYFKENNMDMSDQEDVFFEYVKKQLFENDDELLCERMDYDLIHAFLVEYYNTYNDYKLCMKISDLTPQTAKILSNNSNITYDNTKKQFSFKLSNEFLAKTISEITEYNNSLQNKKSQTGVKLLSSTYSSNSAVKYARQYAQGWNTVYPKYSADCTNFVSQCLKAGGIPMVGTKTNEGIYSTTTEWFCQYTTYNPNSKLEYDDHAVSTSWIRTTDFKTYMSSVSSRMRTYYSVSGLISACGAGDVVQLCDKTTGTPYHTIIVSSKSGSTASYCGHSNNAKDKDLASNLNETNDKFILYNF